MRRLRMSKQGAKRVCVGNAGRLMMENEKRQMYEKWKWKPKPPVSIFIFYISPSFRYFIHFYPEHT